jgi:hypothetical protein
MTTDRKNYLNKMFLPHVYRGGTRISVSWGAAQTKKDLLSLLKKSRIPVITLVIGLVAGIFLPAYISPLLAAHTSITPIPSVIAEFSPSAQAVLDNVPIKTAQVVSAVAQTSQDVPLNKVDILVNPVFPSYSLDFQTELMTHEYLHILQAENTAIDIQVFHSDVQLWFNDFSSGLPVPDGNYTKYYLYYELYSSGRYTRADYPVEEYAYIGTMLTEGRQSDVPANIQAYYKGILNGE